MYRLVFLCGVEAVERGAVVVPYDLHPADAELEAARVSVALLPVAPHLPWPPADRERSCGCADAVVIVPEYEFFEKDLSSDGSDVYVI